MASSRRNLCGVLLISSIVMAGANVVAQESAKPAPLVIQEQGSFAVGGTVITNPGRFDPYKPTPEGQTFHGDHAYAFYQIPVNVRKLPLVMWHGAGQGDVVWFPPGIKHWHGATASRGMTHIAIAEALDGKTVDWMEKVSDEQYGK
jgi:hypothetical protein